MKKTSRTIMTAAVLTAAATLNPAASVNSGENVDAMAPVYGPPSYFYDKGDVNTDGKINILDYCLMRNIALGGNGYYESSLTDVNQDGIVDSRDVLALQNFMLTKAGEVVFPEETTMPVTQPAYGTYPVTSSVVQTKYGVFPATVPNTEITGTNPEETEPPVTTIPDKWGTQSIPGETDEGGHQITR
ncbi:MAG: dockerin type I repeat-containing protein [Oscillospiraceae bacterium]|nr:dockerin type I repeat-containing protein [Oscillospiraceae bacterium]